MLALAAPFLYYIHTQTKFANRRFDPDSGKMYDISEGGDLPEGVDTATLVQRPDDQEDKVRARLDTFAKERDAVCGVFNDIVHTVDGNQYVLQSLSTHPRVVCAMRQRKFLTRLVACLGGKMKCSQKLAPSWRAFDHSTIVEELKLCIMIVAAYVRKCPH